jgi:hypothetical protein
MAFAWFKQAEHFLSILWPADANRGWPLNNAIRREYNAIIPSCRDILP